MRICVLGAGSLGCAMGAALAEAGSEVWLVNRSAAFVDAIRQDGLRVREGNGAAAQERIIPVRAATTCAGVAQSGGPVDLLVVLVKSFDTASAIAGAHAVIAEATSVLSLQNGVGNEDLIAAALGRERVLAGRTYVGGQMLGPGRVVLGRAGKKTVIGELDGAITERIMLIAAEFDRAGLATEVTSNIVDAIWDKLLINVATGALSAITGLAYGALYRQPLLEAAGIAAIEEAIAVAVASGIDLSEPDARAAWRKAGGGLPDDFKPSMLQSIEKGTITEVDFINGAVVRKGLECGVPTPVNSTLLACVKGIESRAKRPELTSRSAT